MENIDYELIDNIEIEGIDTEDYPDFCDAFISSADYKDVPMTDKELEQLDNHKCFVHKCVMDYLF